MKLCKPDDTPRRGQLRTAGLAAFITAASAGYAHASAAHYDVTISTAPTQNMVLINGVYSPTGTNAILNIYDLTTALNVGNLEVTTGNAAGKLAGDIDVEAAFHWVSGYALTLDAFHSIRVNQPVTDAGTGALALTTNDGGANGHLEFGASGDITFWGLSNSLAINGNAYTLVNSVASLAAAVTANPNGNYALAASYDASVDHTYKQDPITPVFGGNFEGLGNAISNVSIRVDDPTSEGFFNEIGSGASVSDLRLRDATVTQGSGRFYANAVGGLAGESSGTLYGDTVSGIIIFRRALSAGGLVGMADGSITRCSSDAAMQSKSSLGGAKFVGGLAGQSSAMITDSVSSGSVEASYLTTWAGGLVGTSSGPIRHSHATGKVGGPNDYNQLTSVGGLVGEARAIISDSYAMGDVQGGAFAGGLVGTESGSISGSFANGNVHSRYGASSMYGGGLVGMVEGNFLVPSNTAISNSYATGAASAGQVTGGLIGWADDNGQKVASSYAIGPVSSGSSAGGFAGDGCDCFADDYWDITITAVGVGAGDASGVTGLTTTQLRAGLPAGFDPKIWAQDRKINRGFPYLIANPPPQ